VKQRDGDERITIKAYLSESPRS